MELNLLVIALMVLGFGLFAGRLRGSPITLPMVFTTAGLLLGPGALGVLNLDVESRAVSDLAEATLVVVLFTDASRMRLQTVLREHTLAVRLLGVGLPLAVVIGTGLAVPLLPDLPLAAAALLATTLAPTDAALGQAFVDDQTVPSRIRQTLNVESGLNDGLAVPVLTVLLDLAQHRASSVSSYVGLFAELIGIGVLTGAAVGWLGGQALNWSARRGWTTGPMQRLNTIAVAALAFAGSELLGGNGFVAAFTAGLVIGATARSLLPHTTAFAETEGQLLTLITFLLFGAVVVADVIADLDWRIVAYALVSLLVVRPVAVGLALLGTHLRAATTAFIGWAGPRGLASVVYAVLIAEAVDVPHRRLIFVTAAGTILLSVYLHGLSAAAVSARYGAYMHRRTDETRPERAPTTQLPVRLPGPRPGGAPQP